MARQFALIKAPSNLGLIEPAPGREPGVKFMAASLLSFGFGKDIEWTHNELIIPPPYSMHIDPDSGIRNADAIAAYSKLLAEHLVSLHERKNFTVVLGGDCSILIGQMLGLKKAGRYGLFFLDGHTDFVTPAQSGTAGAAGMDLAIVTGHGPDKLINLDGLSPYVQEENVFCVGNREYTDWYEQAIRSSGIHYFNLATIRQKGIEEIVSEFLSMVEANSLDGFWIHFDVDALDDDLMPCVDARSAGGLSYDELSAILIPLIASRKAAGIDITILDPTLDKEGNYIRKFVEVMNELLSRINVSQPPQRA